MQNNFFGLFSKMLLREGSRDNILQPYLDLVNSRIYQPVPMSVFKKYMLKKLATEAGIFNLSLGSNFYLAGAIRYYLNGDLTTNKRLAVYDDSDTVSDKFKKTVCQKLNDVILVLRNKYIDTVGKKLSQPEDFGKLSLEALLRKYDPKKPVVSKNTEPEQIVKTDKASNSYTYDICLNQADLKQYAQWTAPYTWCVTTQQTYVNTYTRRNGSYFVVFARKGFEKLSPSVGKGYPLDDYGTSLMAIQLSKEDGRVVAGTSRWNHGGAKNGINAPWLETGADDVINTNKKLFAITGINEDTLKQIHKNYLKYKETKVSHREVTKANPEAIRTFKYIQMLVNNGQPFDKYANSHLMYGSGKINSSLYSISLKESDDYCLMWHGNVLYNTTLNQDYRKACNTYDEEKNKNFGSLFYVIGDRNAVYFDAVTGKKLSAEGQTKFSRWYDTYNSEGYILRLNSGDYYAYYDNKKHEMVTTPYGDQFFKEGYSTGDYRCITPKNEEVEARYVLNYKTGKFLQVTMPDGRKAYNLSELGIVSLYSLAKNTFQVRLFEDSTHARRAGVLFVDTGKIIDKVGGEDFDSVDIACKESPVCFVYLTHKFTRNGYVDRGWLYDFSKKQRIVADFVDTDGYPIQVGEFTKCYSGNDCLYVKTSEGYWLTFDGTTNKFMKMGKTYRYGYYYGSYCSNTRKVYENTSDERVKDFLKYGLPYGCTIDRWSSSYHFCHITNSEGNDDYTFTPKGLEDYERKKEVIEVRKERMKNR